MKTLGPDHTEYTDGKQNHTTKHTKGAGLKGVVSRNHYITTCEMKLGT